MTTSQNPKVGEDEIDLRAVFKAISIFFANAGKSFLLLIIKLRSLTYKRFFLILTLLIIGGVLSGSYYFQRSPYYRTSLLLQCNYLNNKLVDNTIEKLNKLIDRTNPGALAAELGISNDLASNITLFEAEPFVDETEIVEIEVLEEKLRNLKVPPEEINVIINQIQVQNQKAFQITINVLDPNILGDLQTPVVNYFRNNSYVKRRIEINKSNLEAQKEKLEEEFAQIDSLKRVLFRYIEKSGGGRDGVSNFILGDPTVSDPISVFREDFNLYQTYQRVQRALYLQDDFEVIDGFTPFQKPASAGLFQTVRNGLLISLALAYLIILLIEFNKYLNRVEKEGFSD